jgi:hypothetical protein
MTYERIQGELRQKFIERLEAAKIDPFDRKDVRARRLEIRALAFEIADGRGSVEEAELYAEGFVRGLLIDGNYLYGAGDHPDRDRHNHLGFSNGFVTRSILSGKLPAMTETGVAR